jgi:hypothetical protein
MFRKETLNILQRVYISRVIHYSFILKLTKKIPFFKSVKIMLFLRHNIHGLKDIEFSSFRQ